MVFLRLASAVLCLLPALCGLAAEKDQHPGQAKTAPFVKIHEGKHWLWVARQDQYEAHKADIEAMYEYADKAFDKLCDAWDFRPTYERYTLLVMDRPGGGFAAGDIGEAHAISGKSSPGIGCSYDAFFGSANGIKAYWAHILITHEMVNLFTGDNVSGGWPVDWWANHRSPFPLMTAVQIEYSLVPQMAMFHEKDGRRDPLVGMFMRLKDQYGWAMFRKAFRTARADGIHWDSFGGNPSALRTAYVAAYLQIGAPEDISGILGPLVPRYDARTVKGIIEARAKWAALPEQSQRRQALKAAFLKGDYKQVLGAAGQAAGPAAHGDNHAYLMAYFGPEEKLFYAYSRDAAHWTAMNGGRPVFDAGVRLHDPYLARVGGTFHMVHTKGWDNPVIYHWESTDLIHWKGGPIQVVENTKVRAWAPEFTYVPEEGLFYVYWSSLHNGHNTIHYVTTKDWTDITPARSAVYFDLGIHDIDMTVEKHKGTYYAFHKPGDLGDLMNNRLLTSASLDPKKDSFGGKGPGKDVLAGASKPTEGPEVIQLVGQDKWYVYGSPINAPMEAWETTDFVKFTKIDVGVPDGAKHCGLIPISEEELQRLLQRYPAP